MFLSIEDVVIAHQHVVSLLRLIVRRRYLFRRSIYKYATLRKALALLDLFDPSLFAIINNDIPDRLLFYLDRDKRCYSLPSLFGELKVVFQ